MKRFETLSPCVPAQSQNLSPIILQTTNTLIRLAATHSDLVGIELCDFFSGSFFAMQIFVVCEPERSCAMISRLKYKPYSSGMIQQLANVDMTIGNQVQV